MCGIAGFIANSQNKLELKSIAKKMVDMIGHRGPDDTGIWVDESSQVVFGHKRLSILDLSMAGHQPMNSKCCRYTLVFNGEIYNHNDIRNKLQDSNEQLLEWNGHSDTETLLAAIVNWGVEKTLKECVGMFAIALWDKDEGILTLARDRLGEKPLYYGWQGNTFMFASELKALKAHPNFVGEIDRDSLTLFLRYNYIPAPYSIYKGIKKLPQGSILQLPINNKKLISVTPYWSLSQVTQYGQNPPLNCSDDEAVSLLEDSLSSAVEDQLISDVPFGAFLSGGIDSSLVVSMMKTRSSQPVKTFTIGFDDSDYNEAIFAKVVAKHLGTEHSELYISPQDALDVIPQLSSTYDEPFADSSQIPTFLVAKMASSHVKVALSGDGGDELFGGYNRYIWSRTIRNKTNWLPQSALQVLGFSLGKVSAHTWNKINNSFSGLLPSEYRVAQMGDKVHKVARQLAVNSDFDLYRGLVSQWQNPADVVIGGHELDLQITSESSEKMFEDIEHRMMFMDTSTYLPDDILCKVDRAAMASSLETRAPLLNHNVLELAWQLPLHMKIRDGQGKWILRKILNKYVPQKLIDRPKQGFALPIDAWLRGPLREWADDLLEESRLINEGFFHPEPIRIAWEEHLKGNNMHNKLWGILMFQAWLEKE
jgi:asparagine synthase (glutamine-hydrolysing)